MSSRKRTVSAVPAAPSILPLCSSGTVPSVPITKEDDDGKRGTGYNYKNTSILDGCVVPRYEGKLEIENLLQHQVAGSSSLLKVLQPEGLVCKPVVPRELWFYVTASQHPRYKDLLAPFHGCVDLTHEDIKVAAGSVSMNALVTPWAKQMAKEKSRNPSEQHEAKKYMVLEDFTSKMKHPCVMDIKIGTRTHGVDASPSKAASQIKKCNATTSKPLGLRICGLQVYHPSAGYKFMHKYEGRKLTEGMFPLAVQQFFFDGERLREEIIQEFLPKLQEVRQATASNQFNLYSTSLLLVYEGSQEDDAAESSAAVSQPMERTRLCMIDFAHAFRRGDSDEPADDGYQFGIENFIGILETILQGST